MRSTLPLGVSLLLGCCLTLGCGGGPSEDDLGTILTEVPLVPGADEPFPLPELGAEEPTEAEDEADSAAP